MDEQALSILLAVICIVFSLGLIGFLIGQYIYRRNHDLPTGDCACCHKGSKKLLKEYHKTYSKK